MLPTMRAAQQGTAHLLKLQKTAASTKKFADVHISLWKD